MLLLNYMFGVWCSLDQFQGSKLKSLTETAAETSAMDEAAMETESSSRFRTGNGMQADQLRSWTDRLGLEGHVSSFYWINLWLTW